MSKKVLMLFGCVAFLGLSNAAMAVTIATVPVGNVGNTADTEVMNDGLTGYGSVGHTYKIGKYEVSNAEYAEFLNAVDAYGIDPHDLYNSSMGSGYGGITFTPGNADGYMYEVRPGRGDMPVNYVNFWDACRFANWLHNDQGSGDTETGAYTLTADGIANNTVARNSGWQWAIPTEDEWYKAAYHKNDGVTGNYWDYPTASDTIPTAELPPGTDMVNGSANYNVVLDDLTDVGAYTTKPSDSPYGTFDQGGNVWEWNEDIMNESYRAVRGASFCTADFKLPASYHSCDLVGEGPNLGFRVAAVPEPATLSLLAIGGLALLRRKRK